jgi:hypothetical protein
MQVDIGEDRRNHRSSPISTCITASIFGLSAGDGGRPGAT